MELAVHEQLKRAQDLLAGAVDSVSKLGSAYDKLVDDIIIVAAELGAMPNYEAVIARIKQLRAMERQYAQLCAEQAARSEMLSRTSAAFMVAPSEEELAASEAEEQAFVDCGAV